MFERLRAAINAAIDAATPPPNLRELAGQMQQAVIEMRAAVRRMKDEIQAAERQLASEHQQAQDAERRGKLAEGIGDRDTVEVAERFAAKHRERVDVLDKKLAAQRAELALAERDAADMMEQLQALERGKRGVPPGSGTPGSADTRLDTNAAIRAGLDLESEALKSQVDRAAREAAADEQLKALKKKMGK